MRRTRLQIWLKKRTQYTLAYLTGHTQSSISRMAGSDRRITVVETEYETFLEEVRRLEPRA